MSNMDTVARLDANKNPRLDSPTSTEAPASRPTALTGVSVQAKSDFDLHVLLIMRIDSLSKSKALLCAYLEGPSGLTARLSKL